MYKTIQSFKNLVRIAAFATSSLMACTDHVDPDTSSPSYHISQALSLSIPSEVALPSSPKGNSTVAVYFATGVQKYRAQEKLYSYPITYEWTFVAPQADLYDFNNAKVGTHFGGPSWNITEKNSLITGQQFAPAKTVNVNSESIDWLLLMTKPGTTPNGRFEDVDYIQRIDTKGGKAPSTPPSNLQETADVPYTAVYIFSRIN